MRVKIPVVLILFLVVVECAFFSWYLTKTVTLIDVSQESSFTTVGEIYEGVTIEQEFTATKNGMSGLALFFGTFNRTNQGTLNIKLIEKENNTEMLDSYVKTKDISDNSYYTLNFSKINNSKNKKYIIRVEAKDSVQGNSVTIWSSDEDIYSGGDLTINSIKQNKDINFMVFSSKSKLDHYLFELSNVSTNYLFLVLIVVLLILFINFFLISMIFYFFKCDKELRNG